MIEFKKENAPADTRIAAFYAFVQLGDPESLQQSLMQLCTGLAVRGTILLAPEGINGTVSGSDESIDRLVEWLTDESRFEGMTFKYSRPAHGNPVFHRMKVKLKDEIVALRRPEVNPAKGTGIPLDAKTWNTLLDDPNVVLIDTRNRYEVEVGSFPGALNPATRSFREFPAYVEQNLDSCRSKKVAMFCTGGIRCEKASAYLLERGFEEVYQLQGGILNYLETVPAGENRWQGECFVFDQRVAVDRDLQEGDYDQCYACRRPLKPSDKTSPHYRKGVSCSYCYEDLTPRREQAFEERERQLKLARARGEQHIGADMISKKAAKKSSCCQR